MTRSTPARECACRRAGWVGTSATRTTRSSSNTADREPGDAPRLAQEGRRKRDVPGEKSQDTCTEYATRPGRNEQDVTDQAQQQAEQDQLAVVGASASETAPADESRDATGLASHLPRCELRRSATSSPATAIAQISIATFVPWFVGRVEATLPAPLRRRIVAQPCGSVVQTASIAPAWRSSATLRPARRSRRCATSSTEARARRHLLHSRGRRRTQGPGAAAARSTAAATTGCRTPRRSNSSVLRSAPGAWRRWRRGRRRTHSIVCSTPTSMTSVTARPDTAEVSRACRRIALAARGADDCSGAKASRSASSPPGRVARSQIARASWRSDGPCSATRWAPRLAGYFERVVFHAGPTPACWTASRSTNSGSSTWRSTTAMPRTPCSPPARSRRSPPRSATSRGHRRAVLGRGTDRLPPAAAVPAPVARRRGSSSTRISTTT